MENMVSIEEYAQKIGINKQVLVNSSFWSHALARNFYWYYLRESGYTLCDIGTLFPRRGKPRSHVAIRSGVITATNLLENNKKDIKKYLDALNIID